MADPKDSSASNAKSDSEGARPAGGPLAIQFPPDLDVWSEARRLVSDRNLRVEDLATCSSQDPVLVIELLRTANAMGFSGGKSSITSAKTAIVRLGSDVVIEVLEKMRDRPGLESEDVTHWFELHRSRCKRSAILARIVAEGISRPLADECQAAALLMFVGELLAVAHFKEIYVKLAEELSRSGIIYRLAQEHKFDVEKMGLAYLRRYGVPEAVIAPIDRDGRIRQQERSVMKPVCMSAAEMVDAFDANRWEKIAPGKTLPPKSSLRMLQMQDNQYLKVYERCSEYLFSVRLQEERKKQKAASEASDFSEPVDIGTKVVSSEESALQSEIRNLLHVTDQIEESLPTPPEPDVDEALEEPVAFDGFGDDTQGDQFSLDSARTQHKSEARVKPGEYVRAAPAMEPHTTRAQATVSAITAMFDKVSTSEELISQLLEKLVDEGPFEKSALIVVSKDRRRALVVAARGPNIGNGQKLALEDPLSPLAQCFSKIQSFGNRESANSPFGSKSYALAPINADHDTPVALYADCGNDSAVPFEARRIFRIVVDLLNEKLPQIAGGIPVEV